MPIPKFAQANEQRNPGPLQALEDLVTQQYFLLQPVIMVIFAVIFLQIFFGIGTLF